MTNCTYCDKPCSTENSNSCTNCNDCIHHKCLFNADILPSAWTNNNTPPQYACAIFNSKNFLFYCNNCLVSKNDVSSPSIDVVTLNSLSVQINNIKSLILDSNNIIKKNTTYADTLKSSIESSFSSMTSKINNIPSKITHTQIDDLSAIIKNISKSSCNMDYINDMFKYFSIDNATISDL